MPRGRPTQPIVIDGGVARIPLQNGLEALIDAVDVPLVAGWWWTAVKRRRRWYAKGRKKRRRDEPIVDTYLHRLLVGARPGVEIDHENLDGLDNRRRNIRHVTRSLNNANTAKVSRPTSSRFKGVYQRGGAWRAQLKAYGAVTTSSWPTEEAAARAYDAMATEAFGEFARLNFPVEAAL